MILEFLVGLYVPVKEGNIIKDGQFMFRFHVNLRPRVLERKLIMLFRIHFVVLKLVLLKDSTIILGCYYVTPRGMFSECTENITWIL